MSSILASLEDLETQLDEALAHEPAGLPGAVLAEAVERQVRIRNKFAALDAGLAGAFDASKEWMANGSRSAAAWIVTAGRERKGVADRRVRLGKALRGMPVVWAAFGVPMSASPTSGCAVSMTAPSSPPPPPSASGSPATSAG